MSELKAYIGPAPDEKGLADYYLKSEADKVIAQLRGDLKDLRDDKHDTDKLLDERNAEIAELKNYADEVNKDFELVDNQNERLLKIVRHNKYKRCLAMAEWCQANCMHTVLLIGHKIMPHWEWRIETNYWYKWRKIWFELAEKFKEAK